MEARRNIFLIPNTRIVAMSQAGMSFGDIATELGISHHTVRRRIRQFVQLGDAGLSDRRSANAGPRCTTAEKDRQIVNIIREHPFESAASVPAALRLRVNEHTVRRRLREGGLHCRHPARALALTPYHREARVGWALQELGTPQAQREMTFYVDEKVFSSAAGYAVRVWRPTGTRWDPENVITHDRSGRITCAMWGWIGPFGPGALVPTSSRMTSAEYISILEDVFIPSVRAVYSAADMPVIRMVQDNCPTHVSHEARAWFAEHPEIELVQWPAKSPDLNLIENVWAEIVRTWLPIARRLENRDALIEHAMRVWERLRGRPEYFEHLYASVETRINRVIERNGGPTGY